MASVHLDLIRLSRPATPQRSDTIQVSFCICSEEHLFPPCKLLATMTNGACDVCKGKHQLLITHVFWISVVPFTQGFNRADSDEIGSAAPRRGRVIIPALHTEKPHGKVKSVGFVHGRLRLSKG